VFGKWFKRGKRAQRSTTYTGYPPPDPGIEVVPPRRLVDEQSELIHRCKRALGLPPEEYAALIEPVILRMASYVHRLPASQAHHHSLPDGLFRHSLEVAYGTLQGTEGVILTSMRKGSPSQRRNQSIRWRGAAFMVGLVHDIAKVHTDLRVSDKQGREWNPMLGPLYSWTRTFEIERYYISYREYRHKRHETSQSPFLQFVITSKFYAWLDSAGGDVLVEFLAALSGAVPDHTLMQLAVRADQRSVERDLRANGGLRGGGQGMPIATYLTDGMRRLIQSGTWGVNRRGARVWIIDDGGNRFAHVAWHQAAEDLRRLLGRDRIPGIPKNPATLADILIERDLAEPYTLPDGEGESRYWPITGGALGEKVLYTLRLPADVVFPDEAPPQPKGLRVGGDEDEPTTAQSGSKDSAASTPAAPKPEAQPTAAPAGTDSPASVAEFDWPDSEQRPRGDAAPDKAGTPAPRADKNGAESQAQLDKGQPDHGTDTVTAAREHPDEAVPARTDRSAKREGNQRGRSGKHDEAPPPPRRREASDEAPAQPKQGRGTGASDTSPPEHKRSPATAGTRGAGASPTPSPAAKARAPESPDQALAWLEQHGDADGVAARWLSRLVRAAPTDVVWMQGSRLYLQWPQAAKGYGEAKDLLMAIYDAGWLETTGLGSKVSKQDGKSVVIVKPRTAKHLKVLMGKENIESSDGGTQKERQDSRGVTLRNGEGVDFEREENEDPRTGSGNNASQSVDINKLHDELYKISEQKRDNGGRLVSWERFDEIIEERYPNISKYKIVTGLKGVRQVLDTTKEGVILKDRGEGSEND